MIKQWFQKQSPPVRIFIVATIAALITRMFLFEIYRIRSNSMAPGLETGTLVVASKARYNIRIPVLNFSLLLWSKPKRSAVVAFSLPNKPHDTFVKRVIAIEGDRLEIKKGKLFVNGVAATYSPTEREELLLESLTQTTSYPVVLNNEQDYGPVDVPDAHFFVLGDNRASSLDSRDWGPIPYSYLKAKISRLWG